MSIKFNADVDGYDDDGIHCHKLYVLLTMIDNER